MLFLFPSHPKSWSWEYVVNNNTFLECYPTFQSLVLGNSPVTIVYYFSTIVVAFITVCIQFYSIHFISLFHSHSFFKINQPSNKLTLLPCYIHSKIALARSPRKLVKFTFTHLTVKSGDDLNNGRSSTFRSLAIA